MASTLANGTEFGNTTTASYNEIDVVDDVETAEIVKRFFVGFVLSTIIFCAISGNILVCVAIYTDRKLRKLGNLFLVSLAVADLLVSSLVMTFAVVNDLMGYWMFGQKFCEIWMSLDVMCSTASILNLCAISLDRYIHIRDPLRYETWMKRSTVCAGIGLVWFLSVLISFLPMNLGWHAPSEGEEIDDLTVDPSRPICALNFTPTYAIVSSCISFYIPCVVMVLLYAQLYRYAQKHVQSIRSQTRPMMTAYHNGQPGHGVSPNHQGYHVSDHKAAITLGIIMGVFLICFVPFFVTNIVNALCKSCVSVLLWQILTWLGYFNSMLNPIIYSIFNTEFRDAFKRILTGSKCCKPSEKFNSIPTVLFCCTGSSYVTGTTSIPRDNSRGTAINFHSTNPKLVINKSENCGTFL
ncbi:DRD1 (predicted) [Pycnogonum litorale]